MNREKLDQAVELVKKGGVIIYPTDTIWGLGCDATNDEACEKLLQIKRRSGEKSFILLMDSWRMVEKYVADFHEICYELADVAVRPLTIVYPHARMLSPHVLAADGSVGIRITRDPICQYIIRGTKRPLVSTSANFSHDKSPEIFSEINPKLIEKVDFVVDERTSERMNEPSQIISIGIKGDVKIIRE